MYQLLLKGHEKIGQYSASSSPAKTAEKMAKVIYESDNMSGVKEFQFQFVKNRTIAEGGDKFYNFKAKVTPLPRTAKNLVRVGNSQFYKKYDIQVLNLDRM